MPAGRQRAFATRLGCPPIDFRAVPRVHHIALSLFLTLWAGGPVEAKDASTSNEATTPPTPAPTTPPTSPAGEAAIDATKFPKAVDLLTAFIRTVGGEPAIRSITSMEVQGRIHLPGGRVPGTFLWLVADGGRACFETTFPALGTSAFGSDGTTGWTLLELPGTRTVDPLPLDDVDRLRRRANWFELAFTLPDRATEVHTVGPTSFGGVPAWEVSVERTDGRIERLFLNQASNRLLGFSTPMDTEPGAPVITVRFGEWRPVGDLTLFHRIEIAGGRSRVGLEVTSIRFETVALDDPRFSAPPVPTDEGDDG